MENPIFLGVKFKGSYSMMKKIEILLLFAICIIIFIGRNEYAIAAMFIGVILLLILNIYRLRCAQDSLYKSEENLKINYNFLRILLDTIPNPIFSKNVDGEYIDCNTAFEQYLGLSKDRIINKTILEINKGKSEEIYHKADIELMRSREKQIYESKMRYADGSEHDVLFNKAVIISKDNKVQGLVGIMIDITERKMFEKKISKLLYLNRAMLEVSQSIIEINDINELFKLILEKAIGVIENAKFGSVLILDENRILKIVASKGYDIDAANNFRIPLQHSYQWLKTGGNIEKTIIINDIDEVKDVYLLNISKNNNLWDLKSCISAPIMLENKL
ncbi:MAG: PAS domain S-box-containing protein, partial [Clostridium sp.]